KNKETGELYSFDPFFVDIISEGNSMMTKIIIAIGIVVIIVLIMISIYFYKRYKETHMVLKYEENDLRNMANIPKTTKEIGAIEMAQKKEKYTGLTEEVNN
ncbi:MAG: hypothetical protein MJ252_03015, partial [archaeon]|nr:hypothetical protein [archaeon]